MSRERIISKIGGTLNFSSGRDGPFLFLPALWAGLRSSPFETRPLLTNRHSTQFSVASTGLATERTIAAGLLRTNRHCISLEIFCSGKSFQQRAETTLGTAITAVHAMSVL